MTTGTINKIRKNSILYSYLRDNSYQYRYLYRDETYLQRIEQLAKEYYKVRPIDKIEHLKDNIGLINTFLSVME